jgi:hypothetical protein
LPLLRAQRLLQGLRQLLDLGFEFGDPTVLGSGPAILLGDASLELIVCRLAGGVGHSTIIGPPTLILVASGKRIREGKGRKDRVIPLGERALRWLAKYVDEIRPRLVGVRDCDALFVTAVHARALAPNTLSRIALDYRLRAGVTKTASCHIFRHTMATLMLENGADLRSRQEILGHARLQTTERYTQVSIRRLKDVHARTHPAEINGPSRPAPRSPRPGM